MAVTQSVGMIKELGEKEEKPLFLFMSFMSFMVKRMTLYGINTPTECQNSGDAGQPITLPRFFVHRIINLNRKYRDSQNKRDRIREDDGIIRYKNTVD